MAWPSGHHAHHLACCVLNQLHNLQKPVTLPSACVTPCWMHVWACALILGCNGYGTPCSQHWFRLWEWFVSMHLPSSPIGGGAMHVLIHAHNIHIHTYMGEGQLLVPWLTHACAQTHMHACRCTHVCTCQLSVLFSPLCQYTAGFLFALSLTQPTSQPCLPPPLPVQISPCSA